MGIVIEPKVWQKPREPDAALKRQEFMFNHCELRPIDFSGKSDARPARAGAESEV